MESAARLLTGETHGSTKRVGTGVGLHRFICHGRWLRVARLYDELWLDEANLQDADRLILELQQSGLNADLFTFAQALPDTTPRYTYPMEWDNISVADTTDFDAWWSSLPQESRKNVRRSQRRGVTVRIEELDDNLVKGIKRIYDETPIRQARRFPHYRKSLETVKRENSSYLHRAHFISAYFNDQLVGFIKFVRLGAIARIMQIISLNAHEDKRPTNALLAKAIQTCGELGISHLIYGQHVYDNKVDSSVTEFKKRNGFSQVLLPRYYIPLNAKGRLALSLGLHHGFKANMPWPLRDAFLRVRTAFYQRTVRP